eukprot:6511876-Karenia_brevis.AAC.1
MTCRAQRPGPCSSLLTGALHSNTYSGSTLSYCGLQPGIMNWRGFSLSPMPLSTFCVKHAKHVALQNRDDHPSISREI